MKVISTFLKNDCSDDIWVSPDLSMILQVFLRTGIPLWLLAYINTLLMQAVIVPDDNQIEQE